MFQKRKKRSEKVHKLPTQGTTGSNTEHKNNGAEHRGRPQNTENILMTSRKVTKGIKAM